MGMGGLTWSRAANIMVSLAFMRGWAIRIGRTPLILGTQLQWAPILALQFGTEHFAFGGRLKKDSEERIHFM